MRAFVAWVVVSTAILLFALLFKSAVAQAYWVSGALMFAMILIIWRICRA